jgi:integrase
VPRKAKRQKVARGIYRFGPGGDYQFKVTVTGRTFWGSAPHDYTEAEAKAAYATFVARAHKQAPEREERRTLELDSRRYIRLIKHLESWKDREAHLKEWNKLLGKVYRHRITSADVMRARVRWLSEKRRVEGPRGKIRILPPVGAKTINHRVDTLRNLYKTLDGPKAPTPCDDVTPLHVAKTPINRDITPELILAVDQQLQTLERRTTGRPMSAKTRARFRVYASTGKRPAEIMRTKRGDVNLEQRVWVPRDAKGGFTPGVYLNDDMLAAWRFFDEVNAYGHFSTGAFARTLHSAGWPKGVRPYQMRHNHWITASEKGIDLADIAIGAGHKDARMTRKAYVPVLNSRLQRMSEAVDGRFQGWPVTPKRAPDETDR